MSRPFSAIVLFFITTLFLIVGQTCLLSEQVQESQFTQKKLKSILLNQPDFSAELDYEEQDGVRTVDQVRTVMKRGDVYRFEVPEENSIGKYPFTILISSDKEIRMIFPNYKSWSNVQPVELDKAAFTTLVGIDIYYLNKILKHKDTHFEYVSTLEFNGHSCLKIRVANEILQTSNEPKLEQLYLMNGSLYFYVSPSMNNLIIGLGATSPEDNEEQTGYTLKNISLDESRIPKELFVVPRDFRKLKGELD